MLSVPIVEDDQYGTATVGAVDLGNTRELLRRDECRVVCGERAAVPATVAMLLGSGVRDILIVGLDGVSMRDRQYAMPNRNWLVQCGNSANVRGGPSDALRGATTLVGLSAGDIVSLEMVRGVAPRPVVFSLANPVPGAMPEVAFAPSAAIVATGRFHDPNQCNSVLAVPGPMRGALDTRARHVPMENASSQCHG